MIKHSYVLSISASLPVVFLSYSLRAARKVILMTTYLCLQEEYMVAPQYCILDACGARLTPHVIGGDCESRDCGACQCPVDRGTLVILRNTQHTPYSTQHTPHTPHPKSHTTQHSTSELYTLNHTRYTLHSTLYTLHSTLYTLHSTLYTHI
jgi:hypothetical protein